MAWTTTAAQVYADGPSGSPYEPEKEEIRRLLKQYEDAIAALTQSTGAVAAKGTLAELYTVAAAEGDIGIVFTGDEAGVYKVVSGLWVKQYDLPSDIAQMAADAAEAAAVASAAARDVAVSSSATAATKADEAAASAVIAAGYAAAAGISKVFGSKAEADAGIAGVGANAFVQVLTDETQGNVQTVYQKVSGAYVLKLKQGRKNIYLEDFGAIGDNVTNDRAAFVSARAWLQANGGTLRLVGGKTYYLSATLTDISGIRIKPERGSMLRGNIDLTTADLDLPEDLDINIDAGGVVYLFKMPRGFKKPFGEKSLWINSGDLNPDEYTRIDPGTLIKEQVDWPDGDTWTTDSLPIAAGETISWALTTGGVWHAALRPAVGGRELTAYFTAGTYNRGVFIRHSGGYVVVYANLAGAAIATKNIGVGVSQAALTWPGSASHPQWLAANCAWGVRVYNERTAGILMNGTEVYRFSLPTGSVITEYGFGVLATSGALTAGVSRWVERKTEFFGGQLQSVVSVFGDSKSSPFFGVWLDACREALDGTGGIRCSNIVNNAEPGANSLSVLQKMQTVGLGISNYVVIYCGTNDIQSGSPLSSSEQNLNDMLDIVINAGRRPVVVIPPLWLNADQTPNGFATSNAQYGAPLREGYRTIAATRGAIIVDTTQGTGQILADYVTSPDASDPRVRDRIHDTPFTYRLIGRAIARAISRDIIRKASPQIDAIPLPSRYFHSGWFSSIRTPYMNANKDREIQLEGILEAGTKADGTAILSLPSNMRPSRLRVFWSTSVRNSDGRQTRVKIEVNVGGSVRIYGMLSDDDYVFLDPVRYQAA